MRVQVECQNLAARCSGAEFHITRVLTPDGLQNIVYNPGQHNSYHVHHSSPARYAVRRALVRQASMCMNA